MSRTVPANHTSDGIGIRTDEITDVAHSDDSAPSLVSESSDEEECSVPEGQDPWSRGRAMSAGAPVYNPYQRIALRFCSLTQSTSGVLFATFAAVHLGAPIASAIACRGLSPTDAASSWQLLGREIYQTGLMEPLLVWGSLAVHTMSGLARRIILVRAEKRKARKYQLSWQQWTGYALAPFLAVHIATHRLIPASSQMPILALSPSELDYSFVTYTLRTFSIFSLALYGGLLTLGLSHSWGGLRTTSTRYRGKLLHRSSAIIPAAVGVVASVGLYRLYGQPLPQSSLWLQRCAAVYRRIGLTVT